FGHSDRSIIVDRAACRSIVHQGIGECFRLDEPLPNRVRLVEGKPGDDPSPNRYLVVETDQPEPLHDLSVLVDAILASEKVIEHPGTATQRPGTRFRLRLVLDRR